MFDDECFDEFYAKLNDIVNSAYNMGEIYMINLKLLGRFLDP